ncbi:MAG: polysaccharide biosynthesis protein [Ardenticatenaceae bacterium]
MNRWRNRHFFFSDVLLLIVASYLSYALRLEALNLGSQWPSFFLFTGLALLVMPLFFFRAGLYARYWRYASIDELLLLTGTITLSTLVVGVCSVIGSELLLGRYVVPRSIPVIFFLLALVATAGPRLAVRSWLRVGLRRLNGGHAKPVLVMGAGSAGSMIVRELQHNTELGLDVVGFLDDDSEKQKMHIYGVPVLGDRHELPRMVKSYNVRQVIIAMPSAPGNVVREIVALGEQVGVEMRILPGLGDILNGTVGVNQLREVNIEDLLRREPIQTNTADILGLTQGRRVMVTGGAGSIGSELCRQIAQLKPSQLILLDHAENSVFYIQNELKKRFPELSLLCLIADIRDSSHLNTIYRRYRPEIVFHAAAHKHVPLMEHNPCEAICNNVLGTQNLVELAAHYEVERFVLISTDKAVNPTNVMGASKRCAERIVHQVARRSGLPYVAVRFGNVLGSNGSVVPFFKKQIAAGGPVTVTDPKMRRFFMTIPEAVQLVLQAATLGEGGEVFVLDMGQPVRIVDLARDLITLSGLRPDEDIKITFIGTRPGEKLYEELFLPGETYQRTRHEKVFVVESATEDEEDPFLNKKIEELISAAQARRDERIRPLLRQMVPEYKPKQEPTPRPVPKLSDPPFVSPPPVPSLNGAAVLTKE